MMLGLLIQPSPDSSRCFLPVVIEHGTSGEVAEGALRLLLSVTERLPWLVSSAALAFSPFIFFVSVPLGQHASSFLTA